jgi:hypothetical protein
VSSDEENETITYDEFIKYKELPSMQDIVREALEDSPKPFT